MKITNIKLNKFKGISTTDMFLDGKSTILFGVNGAGKSTILNSINIVFSAMVNKLLVSNKKLINLEPSDISYGGQVAKIDIDFSINNKPFLFSKSLERKTKKRSQTSIISFYEMFKSEYLCPNLNFVEGCECIPVLLNYGVNRLVLDIPLRIRNVHTFDNLSCYDNAIESKIDFRTFFEWFRYQEDLENQIKIEKKDFEYTDSALNAVRTAITTMLGEVTNLRVERYPLAMKVDKNGISLSIEQLSDGEKCTLALVGDIARRISLANPSLEDPLCGSGIILIDEIELHMHTQWQRKILLALKGLFPNIQFIITTHSPQVLGELDNSYNIFALSNENKNFHYDKIESLFAWDSNLILEELMETDSLNSDIKSQTSKLFGLVENKKFEEAFNLANTIDSQLTYPHPDVVKARILISRGLLNEKNCEK